ncbi:MAG: hypothetical protein EBZ47_02445 [Chlamydiae bacterium]|nr:hypothetical protein [Chlamydiota bacterium]
MKHGKWIAFILPFTLQWEAVQASSDIFSNFLNEEIIADMSSIPKDASFCELSKKGVSCEDKSFYQCTDGKVSSRPKVIQRSTSTQAKGSTQKMEAGLDKEEKSSSDPSVNESLAPKEEAKKQRSPVVKKKESAAVRSKNPKEVHANFDRKMNARVLKKAKDSSIGARLSSKEAVKSAEKEQQNTHQEKELSAKGEAEVVTLTPKVLVEEEVAATLQELSPMPLSPKEVAEIENSALEQLDSSLEFEDYIAKSMEHLGIKIDDRLKDLLVESIVEEVSHSPGRIEPLQDVSAQTSSPSSSMSRPVSPDVYKDESTNAVESSTEEEKKSEKSKKTNPSPPNSKQSKKKVSAHTGKRANTRR